MAIEQSLFDAFDATEHVTTSMNNVGTTETCVHSTFGVHRKGSGFRVELGEVEAINRLLRNPEPESCVPFDVQVRVGVVADDAAALLRHNMWIVDEEVYCGSSIVLDGYGRVVVTHQVLTGREVTLLRAAKQQFRDAWDAVPA